MGLSNEERYQKYFWGMQAWRKRLYDFASQLEDKPPLHSHERITRREMAMGWVKEVDRLVGALIMGKTNKSASYWVFGEGDNSFLSLHSDPDYLLESRESAREYDTKVESLCWWSNHSDYSMAIYRLQVSGKRYEGAVHLARWWDAYAHFSALAYSIYRYEDGLFPKFITEPLNALVGEIVNRRFEVCFDDYEETAAERLEQMLLLKHKAFHLLLSKETGHKGGDAYFRERFEGYALWDKVARMSVTELKGLFQEERSAQRQLEDARDDTRREQQSKKPDWMVGTSSTPGDAKPSTVPATNGRKRRRGR